MATYTLTAANVIATSGSQDGGVAGETLAAGDLVYLKAADSRLWKADANVTAAEAALKGICLNGGAAGQPIALANAGIVTVQLAAFTLIGGLMALSPTAGKMMDIDDQVNGEYVTEVGYIISATTFMLRIKATGLVAAGII